MPARLSLDSEAVGAPSPTPHVQPCLGHLQCRRSCSGLFLAHGSVLRRRTVASFSVQVCLARHSSGAPVGAIHRAAPGRLSAFLLRAHDTSARGSCSPGVPSRTRSGRLATNRSFWLRPQLDGPGMGFGRPLACWTRWPAAAPVRHACYSAGPARLEYLECLRSTAFFRWTGVAAYCDLTSAPTPRC